MLGHRNLDAAEYIGILKRRRWVILLPLVLLPVVAAVVVSFIPPQYQSQTLVIIDQQKVPDEYVRSIVSSDLDNRLSSMREQILSRSRIQPIIERYNLYDSSHQTMDEKVDRARKAIVVKVITSAVPRAAGLPGFFITFTAGDARTAQLVCADITALFVNENLSSRQASAEGTTDFLKAQLADAQRNLDEHDAKLAAFQRQYVGKLPGEENTNSNMLTSLNTQLEAATQALSRLEQDKVYQESLLAQAGAVSQDAPAAVATTVPNPQRAAKEAELQTLEAQQSELAGHYTADYPDVIQGQRKITDLRKQIAAMPPFVKASSLATTPASVRTDAMATQQLRAQLHSTEAGIAGKRREQELIQGQVREYQARIEASPQVEEQYKELDRDYQQAKAFYDGLLGKMNNSKMATDLERRQEGEQFRVIDPANLPDSPIFPNRAVFIGGGVFAGLLVALLITAYLEYRDTSLRSERDVWAFTQLPTLAVIGLIQESGDANFTQKKARPVKKKPANDAVASAG